MNCSNSSLLKGILNVAFSGGVLFIIFTIIIDYFKNYIFAKGAIN